jgi:acyl-CoA thioester hydrolase
VSDATSRQTTIEHRVTYAETDQMGVVYHANYLIWFEMARTEHLRRTGMTYRELESQGVLLAVVDAHVRYRAPARYDDIVRIRCWIKDLVPRRVAFEYHVERADGERLATGETSLVPLNREYLPSRLPEQILERLEAAPVAGP